MNTQNEETKNVQPETLATPTQNNSAPVAPQANQHHSTHRPPSHTYGRIGKTNPDIKRSIHDIQTSEGHLEHDIERLESDKSELVEQVSILEKQLASAQSMGISKATIKRLETLIAEARDRFQTLTKVVPEKSFSRDRTLMEEIVKKWRNYDHERTHQAAAEHRLNQNPEDHRAEGDINRSRAAAFTIHQEITDLIKKSEEVAPDVEQKESPDESFLYTHDQAIADAEEKPKTERPSTEPEIPLNDPTTEMSQTSGTSQPDIEKIAEIFPEATELPRAPAIPEIEPTHAIENTQPSTPEVPQATPEVPRAKNPQALVYAETQVHRNLDSLFGSKGFWGIGRKRGIDSPHWKDERAGFRDKKVSEVMSASFASQVREQNEHFGIENASAAKKMQEYLSFAINESDAQPSQDEKVEPYLYRAASLVIEKYLNSKGGAPSFGKFSSSQQQEKPPKEIETEKPFQSENGGESSRLIGESPREESSILPIEGPDIDPIIWDDLYPAIEGPAPSEVADANRHQTQAPSLASPEITETKKSASSVPPGSEYTPLTPDSAYTLAYTHEQMLIDEEKRVSKKIMSVPTDDPKNAEVDPPEAVLVEEAPQTMPQEIMPRDPQILASADTQIREHLDSFWGERGFLGFGAKHGIESPHWKDELWGFSKKTVAEILNAKPETSPLLPGMKDIGINNKEATKKMQEYLTLAAAETEVHPEPQEKAEDYLYRAAAITINRFTKRDTK